MKIRLQNVSKRYKREWIFKKISHELELGNSYAILGPNGSGKSTLLRILSGHLSPTRGQIKFEQNNQNIPVDAIYQQVNYMGPYIELIEELTLVEALQFHQRFRSFGTLSIEQLISRLQFEKSRHKEIRHFSSGMKQRLKLILAICSTPPILLLDEPTTNLDRQGVAWYQELMHDFNRKKLTVIASNVEEDYHFCRHNILITDYK